MSPPCSFGSCGVMVTVAAIAAVAACQKPPPDEPPACRGTVLLDCDDRRDNGCETRIGTAANCGGCNLRCADGEQCVGTSCQPAGDIAMAKEHTCVLERTGHVRCWGANRSGELGDGTRMLRDRPVTVAGVNDAVQLAVRERQTCVRRRSGTVLCWGNVFGSGSPGAEQLVPTEVEPLRGVTDIALAEDVLCGLLPGGGIVCLPTSRSDKVLPRIGPPPGKPVTDAVDLAATPKELCACHRDGTVTCWDMNPHEAVEADKRQRRMDGVHDAVSLTSGGLTTCAIRADGKATCWGGGIVTGPGTIRPSIIGGVHDFGSMGPVSDVAFIGWPSREDCATRVSGETVCWAPPHLDPIEKPIHFALKAEPVSVPAAYRIEATSFDVAHCVLTKAGEVYCWGDTSMGRLGIGRPSEQPSPRPIEGVRDVREVAASDSRACARTVSGAISCWGAGKPPHAVQVLGVDRLLTGRCASIRGELACFDEPFDKPLPAAELRDVVQLVPAAQGSHILSYFALDKRGDVSRVDWQRSNTSDARAWSRTFVGRVRDLTGVKELLAADRSTCARDATTTLRCWGSLGDPVADKDGQLALEMQRITLPDGFEQVHVLRVLDGGYYEACGVNRGRVGCWDSKRDVRWEEISDVRRFAVSPGGIRCAQVANGPLSCWNGTFSSLTGHGTVAGSRTPAPVPDLAGVVGWSFAQKSSSGKDAVYVWQRDGQLLAWGHNATGWDEETRGQLGWVAPSRIEQPTKVGEPGAP